MFFITKKKFEQKLYQLRVESYNAAVADIIDLLKNKQAIYLEPVTVKGKDVTVENRAFFGTTGLIIEEK